MLEDDRRAQRERVLSLLYESEIKDVSVSDVLSDLPMQPEQFVVETVLGVESKVTTLDEMIARHATNWDVNRMASIDRIILRVGTWELIHRPALSIAIVISEAVELAKRFSTDESGKFVNGILAAIAAEVRGD